MSILKTGSDVNKQPSATPWTISESKLTPQNYKKMGVAGTTTYKLTDKQSDIRNMILRHFCLGYITMYKPRAEYKMANVAVNAASKNGLTGVVKPQDFIDEYEASNKNADVKYTPRQQELYNIANTFLTGKANPGAAPKTLSSHLWQDSKVGALSGIGAHALGAGPVGTGVIAGATGAKMGLDALSPMFHNSEMYKANMLSKMASGRTSLRPYGLGNGAFPNMTNSLARATAAGASQMGGPALQNLLQLYMNRGGS